MKLIPCNKQQIKCIFNNYYAKYLSQHDISRHYIIEYNNNTTFSTSTFENNIKIGEGFGIYNLLEVDDKCHINIQYNTVISSPNSNSPFNPKNVFYNELSNYTIGPFYTIIPNEPVIWLPVLYSHLQMEKGFKVLNFYRKTS